MKYLDRRSGSNLRQFEHLKLRFYQPLPPHEIWNLPGGSFCQLLHLFGAPCFQLREFEASGAVLLRFLGWQLIIYIPTFSVQPVLRNFMFFGLQPHQSLADAWPDAAGTKKRCLRRLLVPCLLHTAAAVVLFTVSVVTFDERHLGILPSFVVAAICVIPQTPLLLRLFGPPCVSKSSYPFRMLPLVATWTCTS